MSERDGTVLETAIPNYSLSFEEVQKSTEKLLQERLSDVGGRPDLVAIEVDSSSEFANIGRYIERVVFEERFGNDAAEMAAEYGPYEDTSKFYILVDHVQGAPAAALRVITNSEAGLKTIRDGQNEPFNVTIPEIMTKHAIDSFDSVWDVGTVAVLPEYRFGQASIVAYGAMLNDAEYNGINHLVSIIDNSVLHGLKERLGIPFVPLCDATPGPYLGSEKSHLVYGYVPEFSNKIRAKMTEIQDTRIGKRIAPAVLSLLSKSGSDAFVFNQRP